MKNTQTYKWHKSVFSLLIAMAMIFSMLPMSAFAQDTQDTIVFGDPVATPASTGGLLLTDGSEDDPNALLTCDCESRCTEEAINEDCPVCATQPELCVVGVESPEQQAMAINGNLIFMSGSNAGGEGYIWNGTDNILTLTSLILDYTGSYASVAVPSGTTVILEGTSMIINNGAGHGLSAGSNGDLTIQGTGSLMVNVTGSGNAIYCGSFTMEDGSVSASAPNGQFGVRVGPDGVFSVTGGTLIAMGGTDRAISQNYTVPDGDSYWVSATPTPNSTELLGDGSNTVINSSYKYAKIIAVDSINYTLYLNDADGKLHKNDAMGTNVTDDFAGTATVSGNPGARILTLNEGFDFSTSAATALKVPAGTIIQANGNSTIASTKSGASTRVWGIESTGALTVNVAAGKTLAVDLSDGCLDSYGIKSGGAFTKLGGGTLTVNTGETNRESFGMMSNGHFTMSGGVLNANGGDTNAGTSIGITVDGNGSFTMTAGTLNANCGEGNESIGIQVFDGDFTMSGGTLTANSGNAMQNSTGIMDIGNFTISGGTLNAIAGNAPNASIGIWNLGNFTMTSGTMIVHSDSGSGIAPAMVVAGTVSADGIPIKGYDGSAYTIDASFKAYMQGTNLIMDSSDNILAKAKLGTDAPPPAPPAPPTPTPTPSGGGSSSNDRPAPVAPVIAPMDNKASGTLNNAIASATNAMKNSIGNSLDVRLKNVSVFTKDNAAAIIKKAKALGKPATVSSDIMSEDGKYVEVRVTLDPALITKTVKLDGYTRESQTFITESRFKKHFTNKTAVIHLAQEGKFGQTAKISAKVELKDFDKSNLFLYSYDKKTNQYILITNKDYKIDKKGYLIFDTDFGGDIIVSNGRLTKK